MSTSSAEMETPHAPTGTLPVLRPLLHRLVAFRSLFAWVALLTFLAIGTELVEVRTIAFGFNTIQDHAQSLAPSGSNTSFWSTLLNAPTGFLRQVRNLALLVLGLAVIKSVLLFVNRIALGRLAEQVIWQLRSDLFRALQRLSFAYFDRNYSGQIINRVTGDVQQIRQLVGSVWYPALQTVIYIAGYTALLLLISPPLTLVAMATVPVALWVLFRLARQTRPAFHDTRDEEDELITALQENIAGVEVVKAFAREQAEIDKFTSISDRVYDRVLTVVDLFRTHMPTFRALIRLNLLGVLGVGGLMVMHGTLKVGDLWMFTVAVNVIGEMLRMIMQVTNILQEALASAERVFEILEAQPDVQEKLHASPLPPGNGALRFDHVDFAYENGKPVLTNVTLDVAAGEIIAFVGPTGAGKSTLASLIPRFYDVSSGSVTIDGADVCDVSLGSLRSSIGMVFQETFLFSDTVLENIRYGRPDATREDVLEAARIARADEFVDALENGYETIIGERGVTLSGGQRQRLAIARALVTNPRILILDDALASVDPHTEHAIADELGSVLSGRTVFIIAHRLSSLQLADRVVVLEAGRITQIGTHQELMAMDGHYREIAQLQIAPDSDRQLLGTSSEL